MMTMMTLETILDEYRDQRHENKSLMADDFSLCGRRVFTALFFDRMFLAHFRFLLFH